jgi:mono/diheme cytochrome c family protein
MSSRELRLLLISGFIFTTGCVYDMYDQPRLKPLRASEFHADGRSARDLVPGTVARGQLRTDHHFYDGRVSGKLATTWPQQIAAELAKNGHEFVARGKNRFQIYCTPCHGYDGRGEGMVVQRGFKHPPSLHTESLRAAPLGHVFDVIRKGFGIMYDFSQQLDVRDSWAVVAYVRVLQLSQHARLIDLDPVERNHLEGRR